METFAQQFFNLLVSPPGNLIYHLVLAFSLTASIQAALGKHIRAVQPRLRLIVGLSLLLTGQIILFLCSGLAWQGMINPRTFLPPLDRALALFSLIWIFWLWAFPEKSRFGDILVGFFNLLVFILLFLTIGMWNNQASAIAFNSSWWDWIWGTAAILFLLGSMLYFFLKRPPGWEMGLAVISLNLVGYVAHFTLMPANGDYSPLLRLAHICSYPLLPTLAQRLYEINPPIVPVPEPVKPEIRISPIDFPVLRAWIDFASQENSQNLCSYFTRALAYSLKVDLSLLLNLDTTTNVLKIDCGFNLGKDKPIGKHTLVSDQVPLLLESMRRNTTSLIKFNETTKYTLQGLSPILELSEPSEIIVLPLPSNSSREIRALLLLASDIKRNWSSEEQSNLQSIRENLLRLSKQTYAETSTAQNVEKQVETLEETDRLTKILEELENQNKQMEEELDQISTQYLTQQQENVSLKNRFNQLQQDLLFFTSQVELDAGAEKTLSPQEAAENEKEPAVDNARVTQIQQENQELHAELDRLIQENSRLKELLENLEIQEAGSAASEGKMPDQSIDEVLDQMRSENSQFEDVLNVLYKQTDRLESRTQEDFEESSASLFADIEPFEDEVEWDLPGFMEPNAKEKTQPIKMNKGEPPQAKKAEPIPDNFLQKLQMENEMLFARLRETQQLNSADSTALENLNNELHQMYEKASQLENELSAANLRIINLQDQGVSNNQADRQAQSIYTLIAELEDPMSSMNGYMDMLLSENIGKLGAVHKRLVERMKASFDRVNQLLIQLITAGTGVSDAQQTILTAAGLNAAINQSLIDVDASRLQKKINLEIDVQKEFPPLRIKLQDLGSFATLFLQTWIKVALENSKAIFKAEFQEENENQVLLLQVMGPTTLLIHEVAREELDDLQALVQPGNGQVRCGTDKNNTQFLRLTLPVIR